MHMNKMGNVQIQKYSNNIHLHSMYYEVVGLGPLITLKQINFEIYF